MGALLRRQSSSRFDHDGRSLTIDGEGDQIRMTVDDPHAVRGRTIACYLLDDVEATVGLAHDLLERVLREADCDEVVAAVAALRELEARTPPSPDIGDDDWRTLA